MGEADERADALIKTEEVDVEGTKLDRERQAALEMDSCRRLVAQIVVSNAPHRSAQTMPAGCLAACAMTPACSATGRAPLMSPRRVKKRFKPARRRSWRPQSWKASASASPRSNSA